MNGELARVLTLVSTLGCGLMAGVFFAFSSFVMKALNNLPPAQGIAAMQSINVCAVTPLFMSALFGTAGSCAALIVLSLLRLEGVGARYRLVGSILYLVAILLTIGYHVPRNDALASLDPKSADAAAYWTAYVNGWTLWNHVRAVASLAGAAALGMAYRIG